MIHRNRSLDVLRGLAILLVLGRHNEYYSLWQRAGWIGVDLFFVLSGFLISGLLFSEYAETGTINLGRFLLRRGLKIYPAYYFFVLFWLPFNLHQLKLSDLFFMQSYFPGYWGHDSSLLNLDRSALAFCLDSLRLPGGDPGVPRNASADRACRRGNDHQLHTSQI